MKPPAFILVRQYDNGFHVGPGYQLGHDCYHTSNVICGTREEARREVDRLKSRTDLKRVVGARLLKEAVA